MVPNQYQLASEQFSEFLTDVRDTAGLTSTHQAYTMTQGVLQAFRRRLDVKDALRFANLLPAVLRAIFIADWDVDEPRRPFADRATMTEEVLALRADHNVSPDSAIDDVATALRRHIDLRHLDRVLAQLPDGAVQFWQGHPPGRESRAPVPIKRLDAV
jgi:uncharacterized protein (DUF2267 family)